MNLKLDRLINTPVGRMFISVLFGLGLATLFAKVCSDKNCLVFHGPVISEIDGKTFQFGSVCYQYELCPAQFDPMRQTIDLR